MVLISSLIIALFAIAAFLTGLIIAYKKGTIKKQLIYTSILLAIFLMIRLVEYLIAKNLTPEEAGMTFILIIGLKIMSKIFIIIASLVALFYSIFKKRVV